MSKTARYYTLMVIPESHREKTISIRIAKQWITAVLIAALCLFSLLGFIIFKSVEAAKKTHHLYALKNDNAMLAEENSRLRTVYKKVEHLDSIADYLRLLSTAPQQGDTPRANPVGSSIGQTAPPVANASSAESVAQMVGQAKGDSVYLNEESNPSILPVAGWVTQQYIDDPGKGNVGHPAIDIAAAAGVAIKAPAGGTVIDVFMDKDLGKMVVIKHNDRYTTRYGHCAAVFVSENEKVERGQTIALVGNTGRSTAPHLHYEVIKSGKNINPLDLIVSGKK